jgi:pimeloyl-ACP methyl ester carboxylesterase
MSSSAAYCDNTWRYERVDGPGHWMQWEAPAKVNELLLDFLPR